MLARHHIHLHLDLGLSASRNGENEQLLIIRQQSIVFLLQKLELGQEFPRTHWKWKNLEEANKTKLLKHRTFYHCTA